MEIKRSKLEDYLRKSKVKMYCIDASVITNSFIEKEEHHKYSKKLLLRIKENNTLVILPEILIPEVASAISRGMGDGRAALKFTDTLRRIPNIIFIPVGSDISNLAAKLAAEKKLRGVDSVYVAVAAVFNIKLITLDEQQKDKSKSLVEVLTPMEELNA